MATGLILPRGWCGQLKPDGIIDKDGDGLIARDPDDDAAEIINISFEGTSFSLEVYEAIKQAYSYGIVLVAAVGNEGEDGVTYPAEFDEVIAIVVIDEK